ncbi:MAG TPA: hypothetical protein VGL35_06790 [Rhizomicrobium sp.]
MLYVYPENTFGVACRAYTRPYDDPLVVRAGEIVTPDPVRSAQSDIPGWTWCVARDGRGGWVPDAWFESANGIWTAKRDYNALELTVAVGDRLRLLYGESGFVFCRSEQSNEGWLPDCVLVLAE